MDRQAYHRLLASHGWRARVDGPVPERCVIIAEPHTSNWDGYYLVLGNLALGLDIHWMIKAEANKPMLGPFLQRTGAVFVARGRGGAVRSAVQAFASGGPLRLAISPSGTRKATDHWHRGFLHIAREANVPIVLGFVDYGRHEVGIGPAFDAALPDRVLQERFAAYYANILPCKPSNVSAVRFATGEEPQA